MPVEDFIWLHRPFRLAEIMTELCGADGTEADAAAYPFIDREPNMVFIEAVKGGKSRITVEKPLITIKNREIHGRDL